MPGARSTHLVSAINASNSVPAIVYTSPPATVTLIKFVAVYIGGLTTATSNLQVITPGGNATVLALNGSISVGTLWTPSLWAVLEPLEELQWYVTGDVPDCFLYVAGAVLNA